MFKKLKLVSKICFISVLLMGLPMFAANIPDNVEEFVQKDFPATNFRFDGVIILQDNTIYLPLMPAKVIKPDKLEIKTTYPAGKTMKDKPDVVIFNNDFALLKVITDAKGNKSVYRFTNPPIEIATGLLPQDMLVPKGLNIPDNMKSIIGNLEIKTAIDPGIKVQSVKPNISKLNGSTLKTLASIPQLANKNFYASSPYSKNIQVYNTNSKSAQYALKQNNVPISMQAYNNEFLLVTSFEKPSVDVISLADDNIIKQIYIKSQPDEILIDKNKKIAYVSSPVESSIYVVNLENMTLMKQIKLTGMCEKITLSDDGSKLFYYDKKTREIWAVELDNDYLLKEIGKFPNVSRIVFANGKIYITSRTKNRIAIIDYETIGLIAETEICDKPIDMIAFGSNLFILGAGDNSVQVMDTNTDMVTDTIYLGTQGFSTKFYKINNTNLALITDTKASLYTVFDLSKKQVVQTIPIDIPMNSIIITDKVKKINDK